MPDSSQGSSPRRQQQRAIDTRAVLLRTAITAFSERGFESVSVRQLEEAAGVKRGLVAYHFGDKEQLWRSAVEQLFAALRDDFVGRVETLVDIAPAEAARAMVRAFVRYSAAHPQLNRLMMQECTGDSWRVTCLVGEHIRPMLDGLTQVLPGAAALLWGERDAHRYYLFVGAAAFVFSAELECRQLFGVDPRAEEFVERHAELVANLLLAG
ncbi:MAG: TetR family transcriptional regulator [Gammaproteobacteria bacterium]|jgi:TetR/AcrR family transcriptional regulator|nr:TetR family transcriptional regulator [Gammaproteobacteria bacterium]MDH5171834.1 TetR family transcriptional regulator [Gammaproteobacteria bacterium]